MVIESSGDRTVHFWDSPLVTSNVLHRNPGLFPMGIRVDEEESELVWTFGAG